jgi:hypothetical protein
MQRRRRQSPMATTGWTTAAEWMVCALMMVYFAGHTLPPAWRTLNTDFPNYYLTARLAHEKSETSRIYEWIWLQRQKDPRDIDQRTISLVPIAPFSTLAVWPLASLPPLAAKHRWLMLNIAMLATVAVLLRGNRTSPEACSPGDRIECSAQQELSIWPILCLASVWSLLLPVGVTFAKGDFCPVF